MKRLYLILAVVGAAIPLYFLIQFLIEFGFDLGLFVQQLFASDASSMFAVDLLISSVVLWVLMIREAKLHQIRHWWVNIVLNLTVGLSLALPLLL